jgi:hypothetical protein
MQLEAAKQTEDIAKGIGVGLYDVGKDFVTGVWDFVTDPGETVEGVANSIMHPIKTYKYISKSISDSYERDMVNGDAYSRAHWVSYALGTVVTSLVGTKGVGAVAKTGAATTKAAAVKGVTKAKELATIPNLLPYNPKNQLSLAGGVPYNVVNGVGLKDQLISMAKVESDISGKGNSNVDQINYGAYLKKNIGNPPSDMYDPHAHHIVFKKGNGEAQKELVKEGQEILREYDIDPILGLENLVWAPNRVKGQHGIEALRNVVDNIKKVRDADGDRDDMVEMLNKLGDIAKRRK